MDKIHVMDAEEKIFTIRENEDGDPILELIHNYDNYHLISENGYVVFKDIEEIQKKDDDDTFFICQDSETIELTREEYDLIYDAMLFCKEI
jgi:hypothetical protein